MRRRTLNSIKPMCLPVEPFGGNPVAVFPDAQGLTDYQLQQIAREMNLSETVFVLPPTDQAAVVRLQDFYPDAGNSVCRPSGDRHLLSCWPSSA